MSSSLFSSLLASPFLVFSSLLLVSILSSCTLSSSSVFTSSYLHCPPFPSLLLFSSCSSREEVNRAVCYIGLASLDIVICCCCEFAYILGREAVSEMLWT
jgi:hypothetical protein